MNPQLAETIQTELDEIRADPTESVGFGDKAYVPYEPNRAQALIGSIDPEVTQRLLAEAEGPYEPAYRLAVLHVLGKRSDSTVDAALLTLLEDPELRATSAYLLGRAGFKGYPARPRDVPAILAALRPYLADSGTFDDPFYRQTFRIQDFVLAAVIRLSGPERFAIADRYLAESIGYDLPEFSDTLRAALLAQVEQTTL